ncbi:WD repeat-containing protein on Y chromosome [Chanos chanos]|uniref:WD repeat-containing protein on Y chromosome n=1 Tax=Chanos chanos TaxID=29144 RepID=A0A6J2VS66_CHACN|nr:WD repeat-containing protein on Y chromosome-like [Chanos chanos]
MFAELGRMARPGGCGLEKPGEQRQTDERAGQTVKPPEWLERELLRQEHRRHSVALGDRAKLSTQQQCMSNPDYTLCKLKTDVQIQELFMKIDYSGQGRIQWGEFCTYMKLEYTEKEESVSRSRQAAFTLPADRKALSHGEPVLRIHPASDGNIVTVREDGTVNYWSPDLCLKRSKTVFHERPITRKPKWATDFVIMAQYNKLIIGTGDKEIQMYELSSLEPYCQVNSLDTVPLTLDYCHTGPDKCILLYGDVQGCVSIILMTAAGETLRMWKKLPKVENIPNIDIDNAVLSPHVTYIRWKVHEGWVTKVKYYQNIGAVVSTSNDEASALVIGNVHSCAVPSTNIQQQLREIEEICHEGKLKKVTPILGTPQRRAASNQTVFSICKGVMTFDLCKKHNLLVTGGMDRHVRLWNPYTPGKPAGTLKGHTAPVFYLFISSEDQHIVSVSTDNSVKIWDIHDESCLFTAHPRTSLISGDLSACLYSPLVKRLYVATDSLAVLPLKTRSLHHGRVTVSHGESVMCCGYSEAFRQVVSCTEGSVVKVWDVDTGQQVFEYGGAHGHAAITCMAFDLLGRRLVTGGRDGCLKIWNFSNGHCLKTLSRDAGKCAEVCDCTYLKVHRNTFVMSVGWARRIDIYFDSPDDTHHVQRPQSSWPDDMRKGHKEDILCIAACPPSLLATSSRDGEIIVWNLVSGHIQCHFLTPPLSPDCNRAQEYDCFPLSQRLGYDCFPLSQCPGYDCFPLSQRPGYDCFPLSQRPGYDCFPLSQRPRVRLFPTAIVPRVRLFPTVTALRVKLFPTAIVPRVRLFLTAIVPRVRLFPTVTVPGVRLFPTAIVPRWTGDLSRTAVPLLVLDRSVLSLVFLRSGVQGVISHPTTCLISSGPQGYIHFWSVLNGGKFVASFAASRCQQQITKMTVTTDEGTLFTADHVGYIYVYDIKSYAQSLEKKTPKTVNYWRAHVSSITGLQIIEKEQVLLTSSVDYTVRLWSVHGEFIGTFGQTERWSIHTRSSWKHPAVPYEVLTDPLSMPSHSILTGPAGLADSTSSAWAGDQMGAEAEKHSQLRHPPLCISDRDIEEEMNNFSYPPKQGTRLRHEIFKHANKDLSCGDTKAYYNPKYFDIADTPTPFERPDLSLAGIDPFISSFVKEEPAE